MPREWSGVRVAVLGGAGFVGSHLVERLVARGASVRVVTRSASRARRFLGPVLPKLEVVEADCGDAVSVRRAVRASDVVFHLAATVAGIAVNRRRPAHMFASNARLIVPVLDACVGEGVRRFVYVSSACVYPPDAPVPTTEEFGSAGEPEETNLGYGWAKRIGEIAARLYAAEYGLSAAVIRPYNAYGPRDDFEPESAHVIPSLIRRAVNEPGDALVVWGSGTQTRSFLYVEDLADGLVLAAEHAPDASPINLGSEEEVRIGDLARLVVELAGNDKEIVFDTTKPDGQPRRRPDLSRARATLGFTAGTSLREGLERTIQYYRETLGAHTALRRA